MTSHDDIIPLSKPIVGVSGKVYNELTVSKGTPVVISMFGHNLWAALEINSTLHPLIRATPQEPRGVGR